jgi:hypothetical protein
MGRHDESTRYRDWATEQHARVCLAEQERMAVTSRDDFMPHDLSDDVIRSITRQLTSVPEIGSVYFVRKKVWVMPETPCYVLIVIPRYRWYEWGHHAKVQALLGILAQEAELPADTYVYVVKRGEQRRWRNLLRTIPDSQLAILFNCPRPN